RPPPPITHPLGLNRFRRYVPRGSMLCGVALAVQVSNAPAVGAGQRRWWRRPGIEGAGGGGGADQRPTGASTAPRNASVRRQASADACSWWNIGEGLSNACPAPS